MKHQITTFECSCQTGWANIYCENIKCLNNSICRPLLLNYTCECLRTSYSGRYCQITDKTAAVHQIVSKSFGYVAIIFIKSIVMFFLIMERLELIFGIDPTKDDLEKIERKKQIKHRIAVQRFVYIKTPPPLPSRRISEGNIVIIEETRVKSKKCFLLFICQ